LEYFSLDDALGFFAAQHLAKLKTPPNLEIIIDGGNVPGEGEVNSFNPSK